MSLDFLDRLRPGSFLSPSATEQTFLTNTLSKRGGKKISTLEIIDSNESVSSDHGNLTDTFPVSMYFTGNDFDTQLSDFEKLLKEKYTQDAPGFLRHPLWGDIDVFPVSWDTSIELINGAGVGRLEVEFIQVFPRKYPESALDSADLASADLDNMSALDIASNIITSTTAAIKNIKDKVNAVIETVSAAVEVIESVEDTITDIQNEINGMIDDVAGNIAQILFATQRLMRLPAQIKDSTMNKINTYKDMCSDIIDQIMGTSGTGGASAEEELNVDNQKNNAILMEAFAGFAVGCLAEAAVYTDFSVRTDTISTLLILTEAIDNYNSAMADIKSTGYDMTDEYSGDHNFQSSLTDAVARVSDIMLNKSFSLKAEKRFVMKVPGNALDLCYDNYGNVDIDTMEYFFNTNNIAHDEFIEIPAGREIVIYI